MVTVKIALVLLACLQVVASAGTLTYSDTTVGGPTWNRPVANGSNPPVPPASGVGTNVAFHVLTFAVDTTGLYDFQSTATNPAGWDNYLFLYTKPFSSFSPFTNVIRGNDDNPNIGLAGFSAVNLTAGVDYTLVTTGFGNGDQGQFTNVITGPGNIYETPEPSSVAFVMTGLAGVLCLRRRFR